MNKLLLYTGCDVPFYDDFTLHQPRLGEISAVTDDTDFMRICRMCCIKAEDFEKDLMQASGEEKQLTNYQIFLGLLLDPRTSIEDKDLIYKVMQLFFKGSFSITKAGLMLTKDEDKFLTFDDEKFLKFQSIIKQVTGLNKLYEDETDFNPVGEKAKEIAEKLKKSRKRVAELKAKEGKKTSFLGNYMTILIVGCHLSIDALNQMTIPQIIMSAERFMNYYNFEIDFRCRMVGGGDKNSSPKNWMEFE